MQTNSIMIKSKQRRPQLEAVLHTVHRLEKPEPEEKENDG